MKVDLETLKAIKELMTHQHYGEIVPTHSDKDSFATLTTGAVKNWPLIAIIVTVSLFVFNAINDGKTTDQFQNAQIEDNIAAIQVNAKNIIQNDSNIRSLQSSQTDNYNELIRKIDSLTTSIETLKGDQ